jgi:hypothetical protein
MHQKHPPQHNVRPQHRLKQPTNPRPNNRPIRPPKLKRIPRPNPPSLLRRQRRKQRHHPPLPSIHRPPRNEFEQHLHERVIIVPTSRRCVPRDPPASMYARVSTGRRSRNPSEAIFHPALPPLGCFGVRFRHTRCILICVMVTEPVYFFLQPNLGVSRWATRK